MSINGPLANISPDILQRAIMQEYTEVANAPDKGYHFHTGRAATECIGYDPSLYSAVPEANIASFAGTGNPFCLGTINSGETVLDVGSGTGLDALIASEMVGPEGQVIGVDMTDRMLQVAGEGARQMGANHVKFKKGFADQLPVANSVADVVISNGVLNLQTDKTNTLREWNRVLKPGGRLFIGDILISKPLPQEALDDIALWTG